MVGSGPASVIPALDGVAAASAASPAPIVPSVRPAAGVSTLAPSVTRPPRPSPAPGTPRLSTGVPRLDQLLCGGFQAGTATMLYGPPFSGKQVLQQSTFARAVADGVPGAFILHGIGAEAMSRKLRAIEPRVADAEKAGLVMYIDVHSQFLGEPTGHPNAVYVEDPRDMAKVIQALGPASGDGTTVSSVVALQSASTVLMELGAAKAFPFLRSIVGRAVKHGGVALLSLQSGMHAESEVQMAKHLCAGMIEMRKKNDVHVLHVEGLETAFARPGWIEYDVTPRSLRLTGSFATRTIH